MIFETTNKDARALETTIEARLREVLGYDVAVFIRTDAELAEIASYKPFRQTEIAAADEFNIIFLEDILDDGINRKVTSLSSDTNEFHVHGREIYWLRRKKNALRRKKKGTNSFSNPPLEKTLPKPFTIRSARTVKKIAAKFLSSWKLHVISTTGLLIKVTDSL